MSVQIGITTTDFKAAKRMLRKSQEIVCASSGVYLQLLLVAQQMLHDGDKVKAKVTKGYQD